MSLTIFGYGSLIWRPDFPHVAAHPVVLPGWARRFWQGSTDHRGVPGAPGRVVTLVREPGARCVGLAFELAPDQASAVLAGLDHREKGGYDRHELTVLPLRGGAPLRTLAWVATPENPNYLGPAEPDAIVEVILRARGPSGPNLEYLFRLEQALRALGGVDPHVEELAERAREALTSA